MPLNKDALAKEFYALETALVFEALESDEKGLSTAEAGKRLESFGKNELPQERKLARLRIFLNQFKNPFIFLLLIAGTVTFLLRDYADTAVIVGAALINAVLAFYQENKAEEALSHMKHYLVERAVVIRDGKETEIDSDRLVPGDAVRLRAGSRIPADCRVIYANNLNADESILTGETITEEKTIAAVPYGTPLADRSSMVYSGTLITEGVCEGMVVATGLYTEIGKIAALVREKSKEQTPLQRQVAEFSRSFGVTLMVLASLLFVIGLRFEYPVVDMFLITVAVTIAAVPEGLPIALTVVLAVGVQRLAARNAIVRKLLAAETLGGTTVILTDKTGTLTEAKMEVTGMVDYCDNEPLLMKLAAVNTDGDIENPNDPFDKWHILGSNPLQEAVIRGAARMGIKKNKLQDEFQPVDALPFNNNKKYSAVLIKLKQRPVIAFMGAPEVLFSASKFLLKQNKLSAVTKEDREDVYDEIDGLAYAGNRVLGVAIRELDSFDIKLRDLEKPLHELTFLGLVAISDPIRPGVKESIDRIQQAGIRVVIVTGDHRGTAETVARELGFDIDEKSVVSGDELEVMSEEVLEKRLDQIHIYARVSPAAKLKILRAFQSRKEVVAMTGDGINDAPALKQADIGVAVGSGTDVAKEVSDLVILDDNFITIAYAIQEGRRIFQNIRKTVVYLISNSFSELVLVGASILSGMPVPINALQILWINIFSDSFPAVALAFEDQDDHSMRARMGGKLFDRQMKFIIAAAGTISSLALFAMSRFLFEEGLRVETIRSFMFAALGTSSVIYIYSLRHLGKSIFTTNPFSNRYLSAGVAIGIASTLAALYIPAIGRFLDTEPLPLTYWPMVMSFGLLNIAVIELAKLVFPRGRISAGEHRGNNSLAAGVS